MGAEPAQQQRCYRFNLTAVFDRYAAFLVAIHPAVRGIRRCDKCCLIVQHVDFRVESGETQNTGTMVCEVAKSFNI